MALQHLLVPSRPILARGEYLCLSRIDAEEWCVKKANILFEKMSAFGIELFLKSVTPGSQRDLLLRNRSWKDWDESRPLH